MAVSFLFWNLKKLARAEILATLSKEHEIDVLILAEYDIDDDELTSQLKQATGRTYNKPWNESAKIHIFSRFESPQIEAVFDDNSGRLTVRRLKMGREAVLLAAVHLVAKVNWDEDEQRAELQTLAHDLSRVEDDEGHRRTVLVGDFNMNPFEKGMISSHGIHAVMTRQVASKRSRQISGRQYEFFYNPMWGFFGDTTSGPAGTHYFRKSTPDIYFWNIFDQVLIRPALLNRFEGDVEIIETSGDHQLLSKSGIPDQQIGSDHLPIRFSLNL